MSVNVEKAAEVATKQMSDAGLQALYCALNACPLGKREIRTIGDENKNVFGMGTFRLLGRRNKERAQRSLESKS